MSIRLSAAFALGITGLACGALFAAEPLELEVRSVPFDDTSPAIKTNYIPLLHANKPWRFCVLYPHLKDAYWLSVNHGMVQEASIAASCGARAVSGLLK